VPFLAKGAEPRLRIFGIGPAACRADLDESWRATGTTAARRSSSGQGVNNIPITDASNTSTRFGRSGAFTSTLVAFFLAEIGDKTQMATMGLAARFEVFYAVVMGTTIGMMLANIPAVMLGDRRRIGSR
jgi:putative Ca2+/H+ antiporter (TMEM165/GDT1 family)